MKLILNGKEQIDALPEKVWAALIDPAVLQKCIPGCKQLERVGDHLYQATLEVGVAAVKGRFEGQVRLFDLQPPQQLLLHIQGEGANGFVNAQGNIQLAPSDAATQLSYEGQAEVGGKIAGVGQRVIGGVAKFLAGQFFKTLNRELSNASASLKEPL